MNHKANLDKSQDTVDPPTIIGYIMQMYIVHLQVKNYSSKFSGIVKLFYQ